MDQFILIYYILSYSSGVISISYTIFCYAIKKDDVLKAHFLLMLSFTTIIVTGTLTYYIESDAILIQEVLLYIIYTGAASLVFTVTYFINKIVQTSYKKNVDKAGLITFIISIFLLFIFLPFRHTVIPFTFVTITLTLTIIYATFNSLFNLKKIKDREYKNLFMVFAIISIFCLPLFVIFDFFWFFIPGMNWNKGPIILPGFYTTWNVLFLVFTWNKYVQKGDTDTSSLKDFYQDCGLSRREREILELLLKGKTYREIMEILFISMPTVKTHVSSIYRKTETKNRTQLLLKVKSVE
jgi:DNA-binding CsgD family transcriptional regulator